MRLKLIVLTLFVAGLLVVASGASAGSWSNYFGPGTMTHDNNSKETGFNYWTNNRVWRNPGHPFILGYENPNFHYSVENSTDNPFVFPSYGYNKSFCMWAYWDDLSPTVSPVTCQVYI
jgi:hypothetical protein